MYKTRLQELCHQRTWDLPDYATTKQGPDHDPRFQATVTVNRISFHTQSPAKSSKQAQNDAAKLAFDHFSSSHSPPPLAPPSSPGEGTDLNNNNLSSGATLELKVQETNQISQRNDPPTISKFDDRITDVQHLFKNQLQSYAQKKGLTLPVYSSARVGPSHACRFKCKVIIDGQTYESQEFFPTLSKAEHAAAKVALMSLAPNGVEEDESAYKNLLQELAQKEYSRLPAYTTVRSGEAHRPTFTSTVEVEGESFIGQDVRTKKQAELSAAKVAYTALKQRKSRQSLVVSGSGNSSNSNVTSCSGNVSQSPMATCSTAAEQSPVPSCMGNSSQSAPSPFAPQQGQKVVRCNFSSFRSDLAAYLQKNVQPRLAGHNEQAEEKREIGEVINCDPPIASPRPECNSAVKRISSPLGSSIPPSSPSDSSSSAVSVEHPVGGTNIPRHNKVIVHPRGTNMTYPPGSSVLTLSDGNWVAVRTPQSSQ